MVLQILYFNAILHTERIQIHSEEIPSHPKTKKQLGMMSQGGKLLQRNAWTLLMIFITTCRYSVICWVFSDFLFLVTKGREPASIFICLLLSSGLKWPTITGSFSTITSLLEIRQRGKNPKIPTNSTRHVWLFRLCLNAKTYAWILSTDPLPPISVFWNTALI